MTKPPKEPKTLYKVVVTYWLGGVSACQHQLGAVWNFPFQSRS